MLSDIQQMIVKVHPTSLPVFQLISLFNFYKVNRNYLR